jgi:hypothetical protein
MSARVIRVASGVLVAVAALAFVGVATMGLLAGPADSTPRVVDRDDDIREDILTTSRPIEIVGRVRGNVLALGGDVTISGTVEGDVAAIGGSVRQSPNSHVSGDVIVIGGEYSLPNGECRDAHRDTVLLASSEESLREFFANPTRQLLIPKMDRTFFGWRIAAALSSFVLAIMFVAIAPSSISRASERLAADPLKIAAIGLVGTLAGVVLVSLALVTLPSPLSAVVSGLVLVALVVVQLFGRVVAYFLVGRWMQRRMFGASSRSQTVALLLGVLSLAFLGSLPVVGALLVFATFILSIGIILTAPALARA